MEEKQKIEKLEDLPGLPIVNVRDYAPKFEMPSIADIQLPEGRTGKILEAIRRWIPIILILLVSLYATSRILSK